jgi:hypothetical protein
LVFCLFPSFRRPRSVNSTLAYKGNYMASKESYCYRILKSHSLIVDFNGEPRLKNVPSIIEGETFKKWKERVLGDEVTDVVIYAPIVPAQHTKVSTLQNLSTAQHLENIFTAFGKAKDKKNPQQLRNRYPTW